MKILIRNLNRSTTESDLRALFEAYGTLQSCTLVMDAAEARSKGFGFVEMPKVGEAKAAIRRLNGTEVDGRNIRVKKAEAPVPPPAGGAATDSGVSTDSGAAVGSESDASLNSSAFGHSISSWPCRRCWTTI